jgi:hypothetical protein
MSENATMFRWSNGYPDGNARPMASLIAGVHAITRATKLPISVDVEDGRSPRARSPLPKSTACSRTGETMRRSPCTR